MPIPWDQLRVRIGPLGRVRCERGWQLDPQWSERLPDNDLWCVWAGRGRMQLRDRTVHLRPGVCFWCRPGGLYLAEQDQEERLGVTYVHFDLIDSAGRVQRRQDMLPAETHEFEDVAYLESLTRRVVTLVADARRQPARAAAMLQIATQLLTGLLMDIDTGAYRPENSVPPGIPRLHYKVAMDAAAVLSEEPAQQPSVAQLAQRAGYSTDHFARIFKQVVGQSPQDYAVRARISRARQLLIESSFTVSQIADALGYPDIYFFSRQFRRKTGVTPTEYRQQHLQSAPLR